MSNVSRLDVRLEAQWGRQAGQALLEYILVLLVVVGIIGGVIFQLNTAFRIWANNYFGNYLVCLLETGELPSLGAPDPNSECAQEFQAFDVQSGDTLTGEGVGEGDGSGGGGGRAAVAPGSNGSVGGRPGARSGRNFGRANRFRARGGGAGVDGEGDEDGISRESNRTGPGYIDGYSSDSGRPKRFATRGEIKRRGRARQEKEEEAKKKPKAKNVEGGPETRAGPELIPVANRSLAKVDAVEVDDLSFGGFLRYLVIAGIVIALVIVIGGQILQVTKSME